MLRKILRRGIRHGRLLGQEEPFLYQMVYAVRDLMQGAYPELKDSADRVAKVVEAEEKQFDRVLKIGSKNLDSTIAEAWRGFFHQLVLSFGIQELSPNWTTNTTILAWIDQLAQGQTRQEMVENAVNTFGGELGLKFLVVLDAKKISNPPELNGMDAFHLYETFGLPEDYIRDAARDAGVKFDEPGFEAARAEEQARARASWKGGSQKTANPAYRELPKTDFLGYKQLTAAGAEVLAIVKDGVGVPAAKAGDLVEVVLDQTSFYGDSGGQTGDTGWFTSADGNTVVAEIQGCVLPVQGVRAHKALLRQDLALGDAVRDGGGWRAEGCDPAESYGDAFAPGGAAAGAGDACEAGWVGGASGSAALRFFSLCAGGR